MLLSVDVPVGILVPPLDATMDGSLPIFAMCWPCCDLWFPCGQSCECLDCCGTVHCCNGAWQGKRSQLPYDDYRLEAQERAAQEGARHDQPEGASATYPSTPPMSIPSTPPPAY